MRTASMVLGIVGGVFAILAAIGCFVFGAFTSSIGNADWDILEENLNDFEMTIDGETYSQDFSFEVDIPAREATTFGLGIASSVLVIIGVISLIGGILGIIGGAIVRRNNIAAGVMMLIGAVIGIAAFVFLVVGGILALVRENKPQLPPLNQPTA